MDPLLEEVVFDNIETQIDEAVEEGKPKKYYIRGEFGRANQLNKNGRIYAKNIYESAVKTSQDNILNRRMLGELNHPPTPEINLSDVSHVITKLEMRGDVLYGEAEVLDTPKGKILKTLLDSGVKLGVSTRGYGKVIQEGNITKVADNYTLVCVDVVSNPSSQNAYPQAVLESTIVSRKVNDIFKEIF